MVIQHIIQQDQSDCGVACLASILHFFHRDVPELNRLRELSGTTGSGTTMLGLAQVAERYGLKAEGFEADLESLRECRDLVILHVIKDLKWTHYVVCYGYDTRKMSWKIGDPARRHLIFLSDEELSRIWISKKLLLFKDADPKVVKISTRNRKLRWLKTLIREDVNILALALFLGICMSVLGLSTAIFSQQLLDNILPSEDLTRLFVGLALLFLLLLIRSGFTLIRQIFLYRQSRDFNNRTLDFFFGRLIRLPMNFFSYRKTGELVARLNDIQRIQKTISSLVANVMIDLIMILVATLTVMYYHLNTGLLVMVWIPAFIMIVWRYHRPIVNGQERVMKNYALNEHNFVQVVQGISSIKSHRKEGVFHERSHQIYASYQKAIFDLSIIGARFNFITEVAGTVFLVLILSWTSWSVYSGEMTTGALIAILQMTGLLMASAGNLALTNIQLQEARIAFHRMYEFTSIDLEEVGNGVKVENLADVEELKVSHLAFGFPGRSRLLENVSFEAKKGEMICIWGEIGSGKSTLFNILQRYLTYESGDVSINGEEISSIPLHILRSHIGVVPQDPVVFNGSLIENILLDQIPESKSGFQTFMEEYGLEQILLKFPDGLLTVLEEDGSNISGGQRRLINLIRTLYHRPQILLLDEITSDLDQESIQYLFSLLGKLSGNMSIIVLTHDVRVARHSDRIYILEDGKMNIQGSHDDLMTYENLYSNSWKDYLIPFMS